MRNVKRRQNKRLPPKKKPEKQWCLGGEQDWAKVDRETLRRRLEVETSETKRIEQKLDPKLRIREEMDAAHKIKGKVRCVVCNRRLTPKLRYSHDVEFYATTPAHYAR